MSDDYEEVPECARVLDLPPIDMRDVRDDALTDEYEKRLSALLEANGLDATPEGWRLLAIKLAIRYESALKVITSADPLPGSGRPTNQVRKWILRSEMSVFSRKVGSVAAAAKLVKKKWAKHKDIPSPKTLQNLAAEDQVFPQEWRRVDFLDEAERAAERAAKRLDGTIP